MKSSAMVLAVAALVCSAGSSNAQDNRNAPHWLWAGKEGKPKQEAFFRHEFTVPEGELLRANVNVAADNEAKVFINGQLAVENHFWEAPSRKDARDLIKHGKNWIAIAAKNDGSGNAGVVLSMNVRLEGEQRPVAVVTDSSWKVADAVGKGWETGADTGGAWREAIVLGRMGMAPWGNVFQGGGGRRDSAPTTATPADQITVPPGFKVELIYTVPKAEQGSWVSLCSDNKGRIIAGDQEGALYRVTPPALGASGAPKVEKLNFSVGHAQGLLYAFDSLYVVVNHYQDRKKSGLYRMRDTDGDDQFDKEELLRSIDGNGEHGTHAVILSPDGKSLHVLCGNHTNPVSPLEKSRAARAWKEDHVLPRMWDAGGHAVGIMAPGGCIYKCDPDGKEFELISAGYRNQYDAAFNAEGELFTFDADMEWDIGTPWYRPTRVNHAVSGSEFGWRSGSGKWPEYYPDSLPATRNIGPGCPTGVTFGTGAKFPAKYQAACFINDWTFGTMYAVHMTPSGASYTATHDEFVAGKSLPLTDVIIHTDGAMYFTIGGRNTQSALYRVSYAGSESTSPAAVTALTEEAKLRRQLETLHEIGTDASVVEKAWQHLGHADRFVRWAARVAIERQPVDSWKHRVYDERESKWRWNEGMVALARTGAASEQRNLLECLGRGFDFGGVEKMSEQEKLCLLRVLQLCIVRMGKPDGETAAIVANELDQLYPASTAALNREICQLLIALDSSKVVAKTLQAMSTAKDDHEDIASSGLLARNEGYAQAVNAMQATRPNRQQFAYAFALRNAKVGWTPELRKLYFGWFPTTAAWKGGNSFRGFLENARKEALKNVADEAERKMLDELSKRPDETLANLPQPKGPGKNYSIDDVLKLAEGRLTGRNYENGKAMFAGGMCLSCHRFNGDGGGLGPDLTGSGNRYSLRDLLENIIEPSKVISDQYDSSIIEKTDGGTLIGRVAKEENGQVHIALNPLAPGELTAVPSGEIKSRAKFPVSMMPPALLNRLNEDELLDLIAYLQSGGSREDKAFK